VIIPETVTYIGELAFYHCFFLKYVEIPNSVTSIGYRAFNEFGGSADVKIPDSVTSIGAGAFWNASIKNPVIPKGVSYIGVLTFAYTGGNKNTFTISDGVVCIDSYALYWASLKRLTIPKSVKYMSKDAFIRGKIDNITVYKNSNIYLETFRLIVLNVEYKSIKYK